ncbi:HET-domain-containing protein [Plenodomus tracheiphilus IPT5]|uniref:HET-domain-containing protein n=1 Tax=Plenodomus tracheiphilus IPT5 TaxID=1408161 RepID=A0A6A7B013_9PLEO|nr:HET-domain-containing protein [Plenodomus tracheiphilus IPT5]
MTNTPRTGALCRWCQLLFTHASCNALDVDQNDIHKYVRADTLPDLPTLEKEVSNGCPFCTELKKRIIERPWPDGTRDLTIGPATLIHESLWESDLTPEQDGVWMIDVAVHNQENAKSATLHFDLFSALGSQARDQLRMRRRRPFDYRCSPECIEQLTQWISKCSSLHWQCVSGDSDFWPTRVVDVGSADGSLDPKLIVTSGPASKYVALSHCWGQPGPGVRSLRTVASTVDAYMLGIPLHTMPLNYQHAVFITRALGLRYLWIDSLCIHQDSAVDWAAQGAQMDKIYKYAWVTLAATSASDSEGGFLDYPLKDRMIPIQVPASPAESTGSEVEIDYQIFARYMDNADSSRLEADVDGSVWNSRGWTLQERHLARRLIHFSASQVFWECRRGIESECGQRILQLPLSMTETYGPNDSLTEDSDSSDIPSTNLSNQASFSDNAPASPTDTNTIAERNKLYTWWFQVLADYSRRALTYPSDKLPAISGLAKELDSTLTDVVGSKDQYLAGIWVRALGHCLLWKPEDPDTITRCEAYRAPSWSWARWNGATMPAARGLPDFQQSVWCGQGGHFASKGGCCACETGRDI